MLALRRIDMRLWALLVTCSLASLTMIGCKSPAYHRLHGMQALERDNVPVAEDHFTQALSKRVTDWKSQYYLGLVRLRQNRPLEAQFHLEQALSTRKGYPEAVDIRDALAESLAQQGNSDKLYELLEQWTRQNGKPRDYMRQAKYIARVGDVDAAKIAFRKAGRFAEPGDAEPYIAAADFFESIGDNENAVLELRKAYWIAPNSIPVVERLRRYGIVPGPTIAIQPQYEQ